MSSKSEMRRQKRQEQSNQPSSYSAETSGFFSNYYDPNVPQSPQLFEDTSNYGQYDYSQPSQFQVPHQSQQYGYGQGGPPHFTNYSYGQTGPQQSNQHQPSMFDPSTMFNQQFMNAGSMIIQDQMTQAANYYSNEVVSKSKSWVGNNLKYYFAVDTNYVIKKLLLIFFPFHQKDWAIKYSPDQLVAPKDDLNAPDLYIPVMAYVTYILVAGYLLGLQDRFSPEQLGIHASSALAWLIMEVVFALMSLYLMSITSILGFSHLLSFCSYKFVCMISALLFSLFFQKMGYYAVLAYTTLSLCFFLMRSLHVTIQSSLTNQSPQSSSRNGLYLVLIICVIQPFIMYWLTRHLYMGSVPN